MNSTLLNKILVTLVVFTPVFNEAKAGQAILVDTTRQLAANSETAPIRRTVMVSNINYPTILDYHKEKTLEYVKKFSETRRENIINLYEKGKKYFPSIEKVFQQYDIPQELKVLIAIESGFNANAISPAGAVGYWQFMTAAARHYGLKTGSSAKYKYIDDRRNFSRSTVAAAKYLKDSYVLFNDILLTVSSYNCGVGGVKSAIRRSGKKDADFWDVKHLLPAETRKYVMNFIAMIVIFENYEKFKTSQLVFTPVPQEIQLGNVPLYNTLKSISSNHVE